MSSFEKLVANILNGHGVTYAEAERVLLYLDFSLDISGSHHIFRKKNYHTTISLKKRKELLPYQVKALKQVLEDHNHEK